MVRSINTAVIVEPIACPLLVVRARVRFRPVAVQSVYSAAVPYVAAHVQSVGVDVCTGSEHGIAGTNPGRVSTAVYTSCGTRVNIPMYMSDISGPVAAGKLYTRPSLFFTLNPSCNDYANAEFLVSFSLGGTLYMSPQHTG